MSEFSYGFEATLRKVDQDEAIRRVTEGLAVEGFSVVSQIDLRQIFAERFGTVYRSYVILGACNALLAQEALVHDPNIGLLLPCNIVIQGTEQGDSVVSVIDPKVMFTLVDVPALASVATEAQRRLQRFTDVLEQSSEAA